MTIGDRQCSVQGTLVSFLGDTPAVNMVGGFKEGVGNAMRKCRQCMATYSQIQTKVCVPPTLCSLYIMYTLVVHYLLYSL